MSLHEIENTETREELVARIKTALEKLATMQRNLDQYKDLSKLQWDIFDVACHLED